MKPGSPFLLVLAFFLIPFISFSQSTSWRGTTSTDWATASNWTAGIPTSTVDAIIGDANFTGPNHPRIANTSTCKSLTIGGAVAATLTVNRTTTSSGNIQINANGAINHTGSSITVKGNWINAGSYTATNTGCNVIFAGTSQTLQGPAVTTFRKLTINAGSVTTLQTNVTVSGSSSKTTVKGTLDPNESPTYKITGTAFQVNTNAIARVKGALFTDNYNNSGTITLNAGSIIEYASTTVNQTVSNSFTYSTLIISGTGTKSLTGNLPSLRSTNSANGNIDVTSGTLDLGIYTANRNTSTTGGSFTVAAGATLKIGGANTFPANYATTTLNLTSTVEYSGTSQTVSSKTYGNLRLTSSSGAATKTMPATALLVNGDLTSSVGTGTSVSFTAASNITVSGLVTIGASTTFNGGAFSHDFGDNLVNSGTITGSTSTITLSGDGSTVTGTGTFNFNNLTISGNSITAASNSNLSLSGNFSTTGQGTFTHISGGTLTMTGAAKTLRGTDITLCNLTVSGSVSTATSLLVTGNISVTGSFTVSSSGEVIMNGTAKTIGGGGTISFNSLEITGTITATSGFTISQSLDVSGTFSATAGTATFTGTSTLNGTANLFNVTINGTSLVLSSGAILGISSGLTIITGTLNVTSNIPNTVVFNGTGAQTVNAITYHHLTLTNGNTKTAAAGLTVNGNLTINASTTFNASLFTHSLSGNWINNGTFTASTSTVQFVGGTNNTITGATTFSTLTVNKNAASNSITLQNNVSATIVNMTNGRMLTGSNTLTITSARNGNGIILGTITRTHLFVIGVDYAFEGPFNTINFSSLTGVGSVTVNVAVASVSDFPNGSSINRVYNITVPAGTYVARLRLHYEDAELNGNNESAMQLYRYNGAAWGLSGKTGNSTTSNYVEQTGLSNITNRWTCAESVGIVSWNGSVSTDWNNAANWTVVSGSPSTPPGANEIVQIGVSAFTNQPSISSAVSVKSIVMGSAAAVNLTLASGGSLTTSGNISGSWSANAMHQINAGSQTLTVNGDLLLSDGIAGRAINLSAVAATITVNGSISQSGGANISFTGNTSLTIGGDHNYTSGSFSAGTGTVVYNGSGAQQVAALTYNNLTINKSSGAALTSGAITANGSLAVSSGELNLGGNATVAGNITLSPGTILYGDAVTLTAGGNWSNSGTFVAGTGTLTLNGSAAQSISATTFNNFTINKSSGTASLLGNAVINGNLSVQAGTYELGTYTSNRSAAGGQLVISNGATLLAAGSNNFPQNFTSRSLGASSTVHYNGSVAQTILGIIYGNLIFSNGGSNAKTLGAATTVNGDLTINSGATFNASSFTINLGGNLTNGGTLVPATSTLVLNGSGKTISGNSTLNKVTVYGSYSVTGNANITYNGLLFVTSTGSYAAGGGTATVNGDLTNSGVLTSTGTTTFTGTVVQTLRLVNAISSTSTGVVNFNGTVSPIMNSTSTPTFANLNINNTGAINPSRNWLIVGSMTVGAGASFNGGISSHTIMGSFTNNGTVTSDGTLNFVPTSAATIKLSGTSFTSTGTVNFGGSGAMTITGSPASLYSVRITNSNAAGVTPPSGWTINNDFVINANSLFNAGNFTYTVAGDLESNGTLDGGSSTFIMSSPDGQLTGSPYTNFNHFTVSGTVTVNSDFYVGGNFTNNGVYDGTLGTLIMNGSNNGSIGGTTVPSPISQLTIAKTGSGTVSLTANVSEVFSLFIMSGTFFTSTYSITQDAGGGLLLISDGATFKLGGSNSLPGFSAYGLDINSTVEYAGTNQVIGNAANYGNLVISTAGTKTGLVPLNIQNNFTLSAGTFNSAISVTHTVGGNWTMTGGTFSNASSTVLFNGSGNQSISSTGNFNHVTINKSSGQVNLGSNVTVNSTLNLTSGKVSLGNFNLTIGNSGTISNANANNYIIALGTGTLNQQVTAGGSKVFPVGLANAFTPATLSFTAGSTTDIMNVRMLAAPYHGGLSGDPATSYAVNATWLISEAVIGGSNTTITLQWPQSLELPGFNRTLSRLAHYTTGAWDFGSADIAATGSNPYSVTRSGFTSFSPFAVSTYMALPVTWLRINGRNAEKDNIITWSVASELNNEYYVVEASTDGSQYSAIGRVKGAGTTETEQQYRFVHRDITSPVYYYRIRQVDIDGKYSFSKIVKVVADLSSQKLVTLLNNPVGDRIALSIVVNRQTTGSVSISDASGKTVYKEKMKLNQGNNVFEIHSFNQAAGIYYLVFVEDSGRREVVKFIRK